jgi:hypothetical protein
MGTVASANSRQIRLALGGWLSASIPWAGLLQAAVVLPVTRAYTRK